jgi:flagellar basal-body rod protein FlgF
MESPIYVLLSQQDALGRQMEVVSQNIANVNTTGFKSHGMLFEDFIERPSAQSELHMVLDRATYRNTAQGAFVKTDNPLDVAIGGKGYFAVQTPQGTQYTRSGSFQISAEGNLVTADGFQVLAGGGQPITIPENAKQISIGADGTISTDAGNVGQLNVATFANEQNMKPTYGGFYSTDEAPQTESTAQINQGMLEGSNVRPVVEMTQIIEISRAYQRVANLINAENDRMRQAIRTLGKVA